MAIETKTTEKSWQEMTPDEKLQRRIDVWLSPPGVQFATPAAEAAYKARVTRVVDAIQLKKTPDRVPVLPGLGAFAVSYFGCTERDMMYDVGKCIDVAMKATLEFDLDERIVPFQRLGRVLEIMECKQYNWPGHGVALDGETQFIEGEYMTGDEYDAFLTDSSDWWIRTYLPRTMANLDPLRMFTYAASAGSASTILTSLSEFGKPEARAAMGKLLEAGEVAYAWQQRMAAANRRLTELGFPSMAGSNSGAPFDRLSDSLRGQRGIIVDMFKRPEKLLEALDKVADLMIEVGIRGARMGNAPIVTFALHKGSDPYMSDEQFRTFYWPSLKKVMLGLIKEGLIIRGGNQGFHNKRLPYYREVPKGKVYWAVGYGTDIARAKEILGDTCCITGNVHAGLLHHGTVDEVVKYCKDIIDVAGKGGGYIFSTSSIDVHAKVENVKAMVKTAKEYGKYA